MRVNCRERKLEENVEGREKWRKKNWDGIGFKNLKKSGLEKRNGVVSNFGKLLSQLVDKVIKSSKT